MSATSRHLLIAAASAAAIGVGLAVLPVPQDPTELVTIPPGSFSYRVSGEYLQVGVPVNAPLVAVTFVRPIVIMKRQVSAAEYQACVDASACKAVEHAARNTNLPVTGVSWQDASAYAAWLSRTTGQNYRLPTDAEWARAAGERFRDDALAVNGDALDPAKRWLAAYGSEAATGEAVDPVPRVFGSFGTNENGLRDVSGNVWEWTDTCYVRHATYADTADTAVENCGVRVAEGRHRGYISDFMRSPRGGACSVGAPPSNLGIRLVRDDGSGALALLARMARRFLAFDHR